MPNKEKRTLKIFIKGVFFDQIIDEQKDTEYRKISSFWTSRLLDVKNKNREYDQIEFINGMRPDSRRVVTGYHGFRKRGDQFLIGIGKIISKNF